RIAAVGPSPAFGRPGGPRARPYDDGAVRPRSSAIVVHGPAKPSPWHVEMAVDEAQVDDGAGVDVAAGLAVGLPEGDLVVDVLDVEAAPGVDEGQAVGDQLGRLLQHAREDRERVGVALALHDLAGGVPLVEGAVVVGAAAQIGAHEALHDVAALLDHARA